MKLFPRFLAFCSSVLLVSCGVGERTFYVLTPDGSAPSGGGTGIGVGPVILAEYVDRPNLIVSEGPNQLGIAENHRWAGDLTSAISRVMATNLGRRMHSGNIHVYPWRGDDQIRWQIALDIRQFHGDEDGYAVIESGWRAYSLPDRKLVASRSFSDREPLASDDYQALVAAESRLLSRLAANIASSLKAAKP